VGYTSSNTANYVQDKGQALYRRSLYMFWKRTSPPATLAIFDAPTREACTVRRSTTNTPLQALATMNDPQFFEASRAFAERIIGTTDSDEERLALAFSLCTGRTPLSSELQILQRILNQERAEYLAKPENALKLLTVGESKRNEALDASEHAAWTVLCSLILNLDETLTTH
jgi:hypothetical protein